MIDLAGSERVHYDTVKKGTRQIEGAAINKSLLALGNCITGLSRLQNRQVGDPSVLLHIPYRDSKLTRVLRDSLTDSKCRILIIVTLNPHPESFDETFNSLVFATKMKSLKVKFKDRISIYKPLLMPPQSDHIKFDDLR